MARYTGVSAAALMLALAACTDDRPLATDNVVAGWGYWGGDEGGSRFSQNRQITPDNVRGLKVAWTYNTGDLTPAGERAATGFQTTPILAENTLYLCSPRNRAIALDPETGEERWVYDAKPNADGTNIHACRGVTYYRDEQAPAETPCASRIFMGTNDARLIAMDARTGRKCTDFGVAGEVDLTAGVGKINAPGQYGMSSPPVIVGDRVVTGSKVFDTHSTDMPGGVVRAFNARTGALEWAWTAAPPGTPASEEYPRSTPNTWAPIAVDSQRGLVFLPTGNPQVDFYSGGDGNLNHYGSSVVALKADTGEVAWNFQLVHNDIWDYDTPAQPLLFDFNGPDGVVPALAQATKMGHVFILNRETGLPLFPVDETPVPTGGFAPDKLSPTQPIPRLPVAIRSIDRITEDDIWGFTFIDRNACLKQFRTMRHDGLFTPLGEQPTLIYPFTAGGSNWGGISWDPQRQLIIANTTNVAGVAQLIPQSSGSTQGRVLDGTPYRLRTNAFLSPWGAPCVRPPWGKLTAIDMTNGQKRWEVPLGTTRDQAPWPLWMKLGVPNQGGSLTTASGLTFIAATTDRYLRAFSTEDGKELWKGRLPSGGQANPMTYRLSATGKQYVVIAAGGHRFLKMPEGDTVVAYALD